jgi:hypothetical protein
MILGLAGAKRSGKNTVAEFIKDQFGDKYEVQEWSFAEDLKKSAAAAIGAGEEIAIGDPVAFCDLFKENGTIELSIDHELFSAAWTISGREYLQYYGTEAHRNVFGDDFWVKNLLQKIPNPAIVSHENRIDVITDTRFPNEADAIRGIADGYIIKVSRPEVESDGDTHASEIPLPDDLIDYTITNTSTLDDLSFNTYTVIKKLLYEQTAGKVPYA